MGGINTPARENGVTAPKWTFVYAYGQAECGEEPGHAGVLLDFIAKLGSWKKPEALKKYLLASRLDVAKVVAVYEFFW